MSKIFIILMIFAYAGMMSSCSNTEKNHTHQTEHEQLNDHYHDHSEHDDASDNQDCTNEIHKSEEHDHSHDSETHAHSCENNAHEEAHGHDTGNTNHEHNYHVEKIQKVSFQEVVRTSGKITLLPTDKSILVAPVTGVLKYTHRQNLPGFRVQKEDVLFLISGSSIAENNLLVKLQKAEANFKKSKQDFERAEKLYEERLIPEKEYLVHKTDFINTKAEYKSLSRHYTGKDGAVKCNLNGYIQEVFVSDGEQVVAGQKIASIISKSRLLLKAEVSQKYAGKLSHYASANFETTDGQLYHTEKLNGTVLSTGKAIVPNSFYLPVYFEIDAHPDLVPGSFVHVFLKGKKEENVIALPTDAFIEEQGNFFVYLKQGEEFIKKKVEVGASDGERMKILSGVKAGDPVVTYGAYHIKLMKASSSVPSHGHSH